MERTVKVLLVEDHVIVRQGLRALLEAEPDLEVVGEASDGREGVARAAELAPDVVVMDLSMAGLNGVDATAQIRTARPRTHVLVLSMYGGEEYVRPALRAGANGYLLKGGALDDLAGAVRRVAAGEVVLDPQVARAVVGGLRHDDEAPALTARQREILQLVAEGHSSPSIARTLNLSVKTVEGHRSRIMERLGIHDVAGLVRHAMRIGLVPPE